MKSCLPAWITLIVVDDRSFGRTELARTCQHLGFPHVIRIQPNAFVRAPVGGPDELHQHR